MEITEQDWKQVEEWLIDLRVYCDNEKKNNNHNNQKVKDFYSEKSLKIKAFLDSKCK